MSQNQNLKELRALNKESIVFVRETLIVFCGRICMYDMKKYSIEELTLHHDPPFRKTKCTSFLNSFVISKVNHEYLTYLEQKDIDEYKKEMKKIRNNKLLLLERNIDCGCLKNLLE